MFPDKATIFLAAIEDEDYKNEKINCQLSSWYISLTAADSSKVWDDVYGFDFSCIKDIALREPLVDCVELRAVATQPCAIKHIDIRTAKKEDLTFRVPFDLKATRNDCEVTLHGCTCRADGVFRCSRFPRLVRYRLLGMSQANTIQHWAPCQGQLPVSKT